MLQYLAGGDLKEEAHLEDLGVDGRLTFIWLVIKLDKVS
jgi:hypothetical protein